LRGKRREIARFGKFYDDLAGNKLFASVGVRDVILRHSREQGHEQEQQRKKGQSSTHCGTSF
jgi:hypothetical protein